MPKAQTFVGLNTAVAAMAVLPKSKIFHLPSCRSSAYCLSTVVLTVGNVHMSLADARR